MGVNQLWKLLEESGLVDRLQGTDPSDHAALVAEVEGKVIAVDLAMWIMQARESGALSEHFSPEEAAAKVAFERSLQWLRHGCTPVFVVEGAPPEEKRGAQQARFAQRNGYAGGGGRGRGGVSGAQFTRVCRQAATVAEVLGLPVFEAPGEAEATCAALASAGAVHAVASFDSDTLLYGAEEVYHTLRLAAGAPRDCEARRCRLGEVRRALGLARGGAAALSLVAAVAGCDYEGEGARGVGAQGGLALVQHLLQGDAHDGELLDRFEALLARAPDAALLGLTQCTGCAQCGHEGGRKSKVKAHSAKNPCAHPACAAAAAAAGGRCAAGGAGRCGCAFHARAAERRVERIAMRARADPEFMQKARDALGVFTRQGAEAAAYVAEELLRRGVGRGEKLRWLARPSVRRAHAALAATRPRQGLDWGLPLVRSKMLPALMEWDLAHPEANQGRAGTSAAAAAEVEFAPARVAKVQGSGGGRGGGWRFVLEWKRLEGDVEGLGALAPAQKRGESSAAAAAALAAAGAAAAPLADWDAAWLKDVDAEHRAARQTAVRRHWPALAAEWEQRTQAAVATAEKKAQRKAQRAGKAAAGGAAAAGSLLPFLTQRTRADEAQPAPAPAARAAAKAAGPGAPLQPRFGGLAGSARPAPDPAPQQQQQQQRRPPAPADPESSPPKRLKTPAKTPGTRGSDFGVYLSSPDTGAPGAGGRAGGGAAGTAAPVAGVGLDPLDYIRLLTARRRSDTELRAATAAAAERGETAGGGEGLAGVRARGSDARRRIMLGGGQEGSTPAAAAAAAAEDVINLVTPPTEAAAATPGPTPAAAAARAESPIDLTADSC